MDLKIEGRTRINLQEHEIVNSTTTTYPNTYPGYDDAWDFEKFKENFSIKIIKIDGLNMEFDMVGVDHSIANAFRRILIAEVPTMAIEKVFMYNNTSLVQDEILAHRLGLIPIKADPKNFEYRQEGEEEPTAEDTLEFELVVKCTRNPNATEDSTTPDDLYLNHLVHTKSLVWKPIGNQEKLYGKDFFCPVDDDIVIAKLRPGQELDFKVHCVKGVGRDHAKFSPVATASYRLLPEITLLREVEGEQAQRLVSCFSEGVMGLELLSDGRKVARVLNARKDTCSRNVFRYDDLKDTVNLTRVKEHFIFSIDSTGALSPDTLFIEAVKILMAKCNAVLNELDDERRNA